MIPFRTRARCASALKHCKLQYKMDLTPPKCKRNRWSRHFVLFFFSTENHNFPLKSPLGQPWDPRAPASSQIPFRECPDCFQISQIAFGYARIWRGSSQIAPCIYQDFERYPPKWFSAITCAIWLRLIFRGRGSAWFFGAHLLFFHAPGSIFGPRVRFFGLGVRFLGLGVDILARGQFWPVLGSRKR